MAPFWSPFIDNLSPVHLADLFPCLLGQNPQPWNPLEMTSIFADLATFGAYLVIPLLIAYFLLRRRHVHFSRVWFLLVVYLLVGGAANLLTAGSIVRLTGDRPPASRSRHSSLRTYGNPTPETGNMRDVHTPYRGRNTPGAAQSDGVPHISTVTRSHSDA